jgi:hypothetical protein
MPHQKASAAMSTYYCLFIDSTGHVGKVEMVDRRDDDVAQACADGLLARNDFDAVEIWHADRHLRRRQKSCHPPLS